jgi:C4-dicarboxylate transporter DctM subunit
MNLDMSVILPIYIFFLLLLLFSGMPISFALGVMGVGSVLWLEPSLAPAIGFVSWTLLDSFVLGAIPLFVLLGLIMSESGFSNYIYAKINPLIMRLPGGLLQTNIVVGAIFAAITGSSVAECATIGAVALPEMEKRRYDFGIAAGSVAAGGTLGILIPPSIIMIIYGAMTNNSIGKLFIAGVVPGLILSAGYMLYIAVRVIMQPHLVPQTQYPPLSFSIKEFLKAAPILLVIVIMLGSIYAGVATPSEAAAIGCICVLILPMFYGMLKWKALKNAITESVKTSSMILMITLGASLMGIYLSNSGMPAKIAEAVVSSGMSPTTLFMVLFIFYLILGCLMEGISMMVITLPIVYPLVLAAGFDPIWFGIIMTMWIECALLTPPVGINLFIIQGLRPDVPFSEIVKGCFPFFLVLCVVITLMYIYPDLVLMLPNKMMGK